MFGIGILVGLGRRLISGVAASSGLMPAGYYRHLALQAMEEEDFPQALEALQWAEDPVLVQLLVLRLRLLHQRHAEKAVALKVILPEEELNGGSGRAAELLAQEERARELLTGYEAQALSLLNLGR